MLDDRACEYRYFGVCVKKNMLVLTMDVVDCLGVVLSCDSYSLMAMWP